LFDFVLFLFCFLVVCEQAASHGKFFRSFVRVRISQVPRVGFIVVSNFNGRKLSKWELHSFGPESQLDDYFSFIGIYNLPLDASSLL
jgi:hypothetical protein